MGPPGAGSAGRGKAPGAATGGRAAPGGGAAHRVAESKRSERERRLRAKRRRVQLRLALAALAVVAIVVVSVSVYRSNLFTVRTVDVVGAAHLTPDEVREIAALPTGATLLRFPGTEMTERLEANPWVESAAVTRDFPDTVRIRVVERAPYALVDTAAATLWIVDRDGYVLAEQTPDVAATLVVVRDVEGFEPVLGARTSSEALLNALRVYAGLSDELRARTRAISAPSTDRTALITTDDIEVFVGSSEEIERKDAIARQILLEQEGKVASINVRSVDRPTWRGLDTD